MSFTKEKLLYAYTTMKKNRLFEEKVYELFTEGQMPGFAHLYAGEEAMATGVCAHLTEKDYITSTHRGHGHCIAKEADIKLMMAELFGTAVGAATTGLRPIAEMMFIDFLGVCFDQIYNQGAKMRYMFGGKAQVPMVIRSMIGAGTPLERLQL